MGKSSDQTIISEVQHWLEKAVIGLNLCPFARSVHIQEQIRYFVSGSTSQSDLLVDLRSELQFLKEPAETTETTMLILSDMFSDFLDFNDFLDVADGCVEDMDLAGIFQIANFHPQYQFAGTQPSDIENCTNRSPYPILQILRETSVERALASYANPDSIFENNIQTMKNLGLDGWRKLGFTKLI